MTDASIGLVHGGELTAGAVGVLSVGGRSPLAGEVASDMSPMCIAEDDVQELSGAAACLRSVN